MGTEWILKFNQISTFYVMDLKIFVREQSFARANPSLRLLVIRSQFWKQSSNAMSNALKVLEYYFVQSITRFCIVVLNKIALPIARINVDGSNNDFS